MSGPTVGSRGLVHDSRGGGFLLSGPRGNKEGSYEWSYGGGGDLISDPAGLLQSPAGRRSAAQQGHARRSTPAIARS